MPVIALLPYPSNWNTALAPLSKPLVTSRSQEIFSKCSLFVDLMEKSKAMAPMTKEEWEKRQSVVRRVLDEETGRYRLSYHSYYIVSMFKLFIRHLHHF